MNKVRIVEALESVINYVIELEASCGWSVRQIVPLSDSRVLILFEMRKC